MKKFLPVLATVLLTLPAYAQSTFFSNSTSVGIGTNAPAAGAALDLSYNTNSMLLPVGTAGQRPTGVNGMMRLNSTTPGVEVYYSGAWNTLNGGGTVNSGAQYQIGYYANTGTTISGNSNIETDSNNDLLITTGFVGIGTASPSVRVTDYIGASGTSQNGIQLIDNSGNYRILYLTNSDTTLGFTNGSNTATLSDSGSWINASDRRIKENIHPLSYGLDAVMRLKPVSYEMKSSHKPQVGFIAQDVLKVIPELVEVPQNPEKDTYGLSYGNLTTVAIKAIQEQQAEIDELKQEIEKLKHP